MPGGGHRAARVRGLRRAAPGHPAGEPAADRRNGVFRLLASAAADHPRRGAARGHAGLRQMQPARTGAHRAGRRAAWAELLFQMRGAQAGGNARQRHADRRRRVLRVQQGAEALRRGGCARGAVRPAQRADVRFPELEGRRGARAPRGGGRHADRFGRAADRAAPHRNSDGNLRQARGGDCAEGVFCQRHAGAARRGRRRSRNRGERVLRLPPARQRQL